MPLESALNVTPPKSVPWGTVKQAGTLVPIVDPNAPFDWVLYAQRDRQLAYRDLTLASNIIVVTVEATMAWGLNNSGIRPLLATAVAPNEISADVIDRPPFISPSGTVSHLVGSSNPFAAAFVDRELLARDIIIHEALARAAAVINVNPYTGTLFAQESASPPLSRLVDSGNYLPLISSAWSLAEGTLLHDTINPVLPMSVDTFKRPDQNLAARDNILAAYTSQVEQVLKDPFAFATRIHLETSTNDLGDRESETYVLVEETTARKIFQAEPFLPGRLRLVYDKVLRTIQWVTEDPLAIHIPQTQPFIIGSVTVDGINSGENLTFIPSSLGPKDAAFWRQKSAKINFAPRTLRNVILIDEPAGAFTSGQGIPSFSSVAITQAGTTRFTIPASLGSGSYRVSILFKPVPELTVPGAQTLDAATTTSDSGVLFPQTGGTNRWSFALPVGIWTLNLYYTNLTGTAPSEFRTTVAVTDMSNRDLGLRFGIDGLVNGDVAITQIPVITTAAGQIVSITWAPGTGSTAQLKVFKLVFTSPSEDAIELNLEATLSTSTEQIGVTGTAELVAKRYRPDMIAFHFLVENSATDPFLDITLLNDAAAIFLIEQIQFQFFTDLDITPNATGFEGLRFEFLSRAHESVEASYATFLSQNPDTDFRDTLDDGSTVWSLTATDRWMAAIRDIEPRVDQAFRPSRCGDIGRIGLVPEGLELILATEGSIAAGSVKAHYVAAIGLPRLRPLQAWMVEVGLYVANEDFWDVEDLGFVPFNPVITRSVSDSATMDIALTASTLDPFVYTDDPGVGLGFDTGTLFASIVDGGTYYDSGSFFIGAGTVGVGFDTGTLFSTVVFGGTYYDSGSSFLAAGTVGVGFDTGTLFATVVAGGTYYESGSFFVPAGTMSVGFDTGTLFATAVHGFTYPDSGTLTIIFDTGTLT